ncbi:2-haloacid dehalogenase [Loktanella atrilutea]|uniref:(S)-2-haloacid dehalogenase n=1 Tax=Loktanella atrilutea TaxID=366533 RepID=A0A1M5EFI2_LOKAT|nr:haloacid dehalogenase type II [Loktanella atrilutea]SHF77946.1 2-haloacid dehalogenase [Loktanella atrilutea]
MSQAPSIIVFDVNETLLDLTTLEPVFERILGNPAIMRNWFAELVLYSQALTVSGLYAPFGELAGGVLRMVGETEGVAIADSDVDDLKRHIGSMPALPDVRPALEKLRDAGFRLVTLTNSPPAASSTPLERAGISGFFERSFSVDEARKFKPAPETYNMVAGALNVNVTDLCMVACHLWDTIGAQAAGCAAALVRRPGNAAMRVGGVPVPNIIADDMGQIVDQILARWGTSQTK